MAGLSINEMTTYRWSFDEDVTRYCDAGIEAIGVWRPKLSDYGEARGIAMLRASGLRVSNLLWAGGFTGSDGRSFQEGLEDAREAVRLAAELDARQLLVYSGSRNGHTHKHARRLFVDALAALVPFAEEHDVALAIEPMHPGCADAWTFITSLDEALSVVQQVANPYVKLAFDTYQLGHDSAVLDRIAEIAPCVGIVHLADAHTAPTREQNRCLLGDGMLPLAQIIDALQRGGYDGYYDVELIGEEVESHDYLELLARSKNAFQQFVRNPIAH